MNQMRAVVCEGAGGADVLRVATVERPAPWPNLAQQVLIRIHAAGINRPDVLQRKGNYPVPPGTSDIPGLEVAGDIVAGDEAALREAGFKVRDVPEGHICCGSAGVYNILQPEIAGRLRTRKVGNIARIKPEIIATGNIGCMTQLRDRLGAAGQPIPVWHTMEALAMAYQGV